MALVKICPTCKAENRPDDMMCARCFGDVSWVKAVDPDEERRRLREKAVDSPQSIALDPGDGTVLEVCHDDVVGRNATGMDYLQSKEKVSRRHARFLYKNGSWYVEDMGSTNGTFIRGVRIEPHTLVVVREGDEISLSSSCRFRITITGKGE